MGDSIRQRGRLFGLDLRDQSLENLFRTTNLDFKGAQHAGTQLHSVFQASRDRATLIAGRFRPIDKLLNGSVQVCMGQFIVHRCRATSVAGGIITDIVRRNAENPPLVALILKRSWCGTCSHGMSPAKHGHRQTWRSTGPPTVSVTPQGALDLPDDSREV